MLGSIKDRKKRFEAAADYLGNRIDSVITNDESADALREIGVDTAELGAALISAHSTSLAMGVGAIMLKVGKLKSEDEMRIFASEMAQGIADIAFSKLKEL